MEIKMFTGIVQKTAVVKSITHTSATSIELMISNPYASEMKTDPIQLGESIANNGVCLTVTQVSSDHLRFDLAPETLKATALGQLKVGQKLNLERALRVGERLSGHWVQGHVDGIAEVVELKAATKDYYDYTIKIVDPSFMKYFIHKGSICVDGISLTIHEVGHDTLKFQLIPHTWRETAMSERYPGDLVNFEVDILAKLAERLSLYAKT